jgi:hypothetical protein
LSSIKKDLQCTFDRSSPASLLSHEFGLGGHAGNAKELLRQAENEMKLAAPAANRYQHGECWRAARRQ